MPKIVQYQPDQVRTEVTNQPLAQSAPAGAFGEDIARGVADVARAGIQLKKRVDTTSAEEALTQFEREKNDLFFNPENGYFNTQGKNAYDGAADTVKALEELKSRYGENLNEQSRAMFNTAAERHITNSRTEIDRHASKGLKAWEVSTIDAQVENTIENASLYWNDPDKLRVQNVLGRQAIMDSAKLSGESAEATNEKLQTFNSSFAKATITAATYSGSEKGKEALDKYGDQLEGPDKLKMEAAIKKQAKQEKTQADARMAVLTATNLNDKFDSRSDIIDQVNAIEDPELRKKTMAEAMVQFNLNKQAKKETEAEYYNRGIEFFNRGGTAEQFKAQDPEAWEGMTEQQRNNILTGKHLITDQILYHSLMNMPKSELAKQNSVDYVDRINSRDLKTLDSAIKQAKNGQSITSIQSASKKAAQVAETFFGKQSTWAKNKTKNEGVQRFLTEAQGEIQAEEEEKQRKLTPTEIDDVLARFSREFVAERSLGGFDYLMPDLKINIKTAPPEKVSQLSQLVDTYGEDTLKQITQALQQNDKPVTIDNILKVYEQAVR